MKTRLDHAEKEIAEIKVTLVPLKAKLDRMHDKKGEDNNRLQIFAGMLDMFKENQDEFAKSFREEQSNFTKVFREEMKTLSGDIAKLMNWKFMLIGGGIVCVALASSAVIVFKLWMDYHAAI